MTPMEGSKSEVKIENHDCVLYCHQAEEEGG